MKIRKTEITVESFEVLVIRQKGNLARGWCSICGRQTAFINLDDACMSGLNMAAVQQEIHIGQLHLIEIPGDFSFVCLDSLAQAVSSGKADDPSPNGISQLQHQSEREDNQIE